MRNSKAVPTGASEITGRTRLFGAITHGFAHPPDGAEITLSYPLLGPDTEPDITAAAIAHRRAHRHYLQGSVKSMPFEQSTASKSMMPPNDDIWLEHAIWDPAITPSSGETARKPRITEAGPVVESWLVDWTIETGLAAAEAGDSWVAQAEFRNHAFQAIMGLSSPSFYIDEHAGILRPSASLRIWPGSVESSIAVSTRFARIGSHFIRLEQFVEWTERNTAQAGQVCAALGGAVASYLQRILPRITVFADGKADADASVLRLASQLRKLDEQIAFLARLCGVAVPVDGSSPRPVTDCVMHLARGSALVSALYDCACDEVGLQHLAIAYSMFAAACQPFLSFLEEWLWDGVYVDAYDEFGFTEHPEHLNARDSRYWHSGIVMSNIEAWPHFLQGTGTALHSCGKSIMLLRKCVPSHFLCDASLRPPSLQISFTPTDLPAIQNDVMAYAAQINDLARQHTGRRLSAAIAKSRDRQRVHAEAIQRGEEAQRRRLANKEAKRKLRLERQRLAQETFESGVAAAEHSKQLAKARAEAFESERNRILQQREAAAKRLIAEEMAAARARYAEYEAAAAKKEALARWRIARLRLAPKRDKFLVDRARYEAEQLWKVHHQDDKQQKHHEPQQEKQPDIQSIASARSTPDKAEEIVSTTELIGRLAVKNQQTPPVPSGNPSLNGYTLSPLPLHVPDSAEYTGPGNSKSRQTWGTPIDLRGAAGDASPAVEQDLSLPALLSPDLGKDFVSNDSGEGEPVGVDETEDSQGTIDAVDLVHSSREGLSECGSTTPAGQASGSIEYRHPSDASVGDILYPGGVSRDSPGGRALARTLSELPLVDGKEVRETLQSLPLIIDEAENESRVVTSDNSNSHVPLHAQHISASSAVDTSNLINGDGDKIKPKLYRKNEQKRRSSSVTSERVEAATVAVGHASDSSAQVRMYLQTSTERSAGHVDPTAVLPGASSRASGTSLVDTIGEAPPFSSHQETFESNSCPFALFDAAPAFNDNLVNTAETRKGVRQPPQEGSSFRLGPSEAPRFESCEVVIRECILTPIMHQINAANAAVVELFLDDLGLVSHVEAIRNFVLFGSGEWAHCLTSKVQGALERMDGERMLPEAIVTTVLLQETLADSRQDDHPCASQLSLALSRSVKPQLVDKCGLGALDFLSVNYTAPWPLNIVLDSSCISDCNRVFLLQLKVKRAVWALQDVHIQLKRQQPSLGEPLPLVKRFRALEGYRHEMYHVVSVLSEYFSHQVLDVSWAEFQRPFEARRAGHHGALPNVDSVAAHHRDYIEKVIFRSLLNENAAPVMKVLESILALALKVRGQVASCPGKWRDPLMFARLTQTHAKFRECAAFLFAVTTKLVERGYQPHLEELLLRMDFNGYLTQCAEKASRV